MRAEQPFSQVLDSLFTDERVVISLLYRLSDMSAEEYSQFTGRWLDVPADRRQALTRHLADLSEDNFRVDFSPIFAFCLGDPSSPVRLAALDGLWDATNTALITPILNMAQNDEEVEVRKAAVEALGHYVLMAEWGELPKKIVPPITKALLDLYRGDRTDAAIRRSALEVLGAADDPRVPPLIQAAYDSDDRANRVSALFAMGRSADRRWLPTILREMSSRYFDLRLEAARAAGGIGAEQAVAHLAGLLEDDDLEVKLAAVASLGQIGGDRAGAILTRLANDPDAADLHEAIEEALEEAEWLGGEFELPMFDLDEDDEEFGD